MSELLTGLDNLDTSYFSETEQRAWKKFQDRKREFLESLDLFSSSFSSGPASPEQETSQDIANLFAQAAERLDGVIDSTQKVTNGVIDRVEKISEMQEEILDKLAEIKKNIKTLDGKPEAESVTSITGQIETLESEIQSEAMGLMHEMQFQDITSQQIRQVIYLLGEIENNLNSFGRLIPLFSDKRESRLAENSRQLGFDPDATTSDSEKRQAVADKIVRKFPNK